MEGSCSYELSAQSCQDTLGIWNSFHQTSMTFAQVTETMRAYLGLQMFTTYTITNVGQSCHHGHPRHVLNAKSLVLVDWGVHQQDTWASEFQVAMWSIVMDSGTLASQPPNFFHSASHKKTRRNGAEHRSAYHNTAMYLVPAINLVFRNQSRISLVIFRVQT